VVAWSKAAGQYQWGLLGATLAFSGAYLTVVTSALNHNSLAGLATGNPHTQYTRAAADEVIGGQWNFHHALQVTASDAWIDMVDTTADVDARRTLVDFRDGYSISYLSDTGMDGTTLYSADRYDGYGLDAIQYAPTTGALHEFFGDVRIEDDDALGFGEGNDLQIWSDADEVTLLFGLPFALIGPGGGVEVSEDRTDITTTEATHHGVALLTADDATAGVYTPTSTDVANLDASSVSECQWLRVGDVVTVSGLVLVDPTAPGDSQLRLTLPIPSAFDAPEQCSGVACCPTIAGQCAAIYADVASGEAMMQWLAVDVTEQPMSFHFTYLVL
jgi:hypothetical protein